MEGDDAKKTKTKHCSHCGNFSLASLVSLPSLEAVLSHLRRGLCAEKCLYDSYLPMAAWSVPAKRRCANSLEPGQAPLRVLLLWQGQTLWGCQVAAVYFFGQGLKDKSARLHLKLLVSRRMPVASAGSAAKAAGLGERTVLTPYAGNCLPLCSVSAPVMCTAAVKGAARTKDKEDFIPNMYEFVVLLLFCFFHSDSRINLR